MKYILLVFAGVLMTACTKEVKRNDYVTFSGTIVNKKSDSIQIVKRGYAKVIAVHDDGTFKDTLKVAPGMYYFSDGNESASLFLKNGYDIDMDIDTDQFDESLQFEGYGADDNTYLAKKSLYEEKLFDQDFSMLNEAELDTKVEALKAEMTTFIDSQKNIDTLLINQNKRDLDGMLASLKGYYGEVIAIKKEFPKGKKSPVFSEYQNFKGGTTSLADLKGKNVYVDVWATWCAPCKAEIPALKQLEHDYEGENIAFVSMSIDDDRSHKGSWDLANENWRAMVTDKELGGIQIFAPKGWKSQFVKDYRINGIPRFILIDTEGNVIDANAPRPSDEKLRSLFDEII